ncbi:hypothetical protein LIER_36800 [Lithospermum erythrorhizon]|uniref:Uncharacterized protein n=1 Tax=Lithospermum erythrorhizon TaxID=34254 RepID=A0AAV3PFG1_LITER
MKPLLSKKVATQYKELKGPFIVFAQFAKHITAVRLLPSLLARVIIVLAIKFAAEKANKQARYEELEQANASEIMKASEALDKAKKEREVALDSTAAEAGVERIRYAKEVLMSFMNSLEYIAKVGCECASYLTLFVNSCKSKSLGWWLFTMKRRIAIRIGSISYPWMRHHPL